MEKKKFYSVEKEINGKKYVAQFNGLSCALRAADQSYIDGSENTSVEKFAKYVFENVIVEPKNLEIDDFDNIKEFEAVVAFGRAVMEGNFRNNSTDKATAEK